MVISKIDFKLYYDGKSSSGDKGSKAQMLQSLIRMLHDEDFLITDLSALNFGRATEGRRFCYRGYKVTAWLRATPSLPLPEEP